uniref:Uncharacterized protein n=1 Tax=Chromera velia CCMP2878 TaxID=1169474 RepID=A0A0G4FI16_9ALVE|eukprot:Cvel_3361.t1-p1 / transcript=Cvel_3361.t1 / gene=Cvel_3361 / organism=Chromera_velia_CCMP2878 / gene_product=hypothetical protein / transcript_product=hypothetical protein / location=Cvel_scaffold134:55085-56772(+) / protein_length=189 / sequence_SO=supercontig / SO=protein_coding / is_pseudo=false
MMRMSAALIFALFGLVSSSLLTGTGKFSANETVGETGHHNQDQKAEAHRCLTPGDDDYMTGYCLSYRYNERTQEKYEACYDKCVDDDETNDPFPGGQQACYVGCRDSIKGTNADVGHCCSRKSTNAVNCYRYCCKSWGANERTLWGLHLPDGYCTYCTWVEHEAADPPLPSAADSRNRAGACAAITDAP